MPTYAPGIPLNRLADTLKVAGLENKESCWNSGIQREVLQAAMRVLSCMTGGEEISPSDLELVRSHTSAHELNLPIDAMTRLVALRILVEE